MDLEALCARRPPGWDEATWLLLAGGRAVEAARLPEALRALIPALCADGLLEPGPPGAVRAGGWVLVGCRGLLLLVDPPAQYGAERPEVYLGPDSLWLAGWVPAMRPGAWTWDLGAGSGLQGLLAARGGGRSVLTDVSARCLTASAANAVLNGLAERIDVRGGDLARPVRGLRFDLVVSLAPYVPDVEGIALPGFAGGGPDGAAFLRRILEVLPETLAPRGVFVAFAYLLADEAAPLLRRLPLPEALEVRVEAAAALSADAFAAALGERLRRQLPPELAAQRYAAHFRRLGVTRVEAALVRAWRRDRPAEAGPLQSGPASLG